MTKEADDAWTCLGPIPQGTESESTMRALRTRYAEYLVPPQPDRGAPHKRMRVLPDVVEGMLLNMCTDDPGITNPIVEVGLRLADDTVVALSFAQASLIAKLFKDYASLGNGEDKRGRPIYGSMALSEVA